MASVAAQGTVRAWPLRVFDSLIKGDAAPLQRVLAGIAVLTLLRFILAAWLPLSFDEAYYWLWSRHLALSYFDHPPAIAYAIRAGTAIFGDTSFGVRFVALASSVLASWAVWDSARLLLGNRHTAGLACLYFNLTLMVAAETMAATPDAMALAAAVFVLWSLVKLQASGDGRWWLAVGAAGGLCLLSKYTGFFLGAGVLFWLIAARAGRRWLTSPWPYVAGVLALGLFAPVIVWNASHDWQSFKFQFGRVAEGGWTPRYLLEFVLAQLALASPFLLLLAGAGFARASRFNKDAPPIALLACLMWPSLAYFAVHALHDRVQGNWPSYLFPVLAILAAYAGSAVWHGTRVRRFVTVCRALAAPVAALLLAAVYAQAFFGVVHTRDPIVRLAAIDFAPVAAEIEHRAQEQKARAIVTTSYATTAWLAFYLKPTIPVVQANETFRWLAAPEAAPALAHGPLLYVTLAPKKPGAHRALPAIASQFTQLHYLGGVDRRRHNVWIETYDIYSASGWDGAVLGRTPR